jgi:ubiquinone/menaquinone biosynthesis C-methylase UbiE
MDLKKDAYGQEIMDFFKGQESYEIVERDDGFIAPSAGPKFYFQEYKDWPKIEKEAIKYAKGEVLDIGAGAGRVALYLQKIGFRVTAIDNSPLTIKVCQKRGVKKAIVLPIERISTFKRDTFDTIIMYGNNFGLFNSFQRAKLLLKTMVRITKPNAVIIAESNDPYQTKETVHRHYHKLNMSRGNLCGQTRIRIRYKNFIGDWFSYLLVSKKEMKDILNGTGWKIDKFIDSPGSAYIAIIRKEKTLTKNNDSFRKLIWPLS